MLTVTPPANGADKAARNEAPSPSLASILVGLTGFEADQAAVDTARVAAHFGGVHIRGVYVHPTAADLVSTASGGLYEMVSPEALDALRDDDKRRTAVAHAMFADMCKKLKIDHVSAQAAGNGMRAEWLEYTDDRTRRLASELRYHDVAILSRAPELHDARMLGELLIRSGRPILLTGTHTPENFENVVIAWKETAEAARAVTMAMPFLAKAKRIVVLAASEDATCTQCNDVTHSAERVAAYLAEHHLEAEAHLVLPSGRTLPHALFETAHKFKAGMLVMGGYSHSRVNELVFGGLTRDILTNTWPLPVFLGH